MRKGFFNQYDWVHDIHLFWTEKKTGRYSNTIIVLFFLPSSSIIMFFKGRFLPRSKVVKAEAVEVELPHNLLSHDDLRVPQRLLRLLLKQQRHDNYSESPCCVLCFGKDLYEWIQVKCRVSKYLLYYILSWLFKICCQYLSLQIWGHPWNRSASNEVGRG